MSVSYALSDEERGSTPTAGCGTRKWNASIKYLHKNRENRISLIVTVHGRFFNSYRNFESSVKRIDSVKNACYSTNRTDKESQELFTWEIRKRLDWRCLMMETKRDYYEVLGVSRNADEKEIKRAYRKLAKNIIPIRMRETRMRKRNLRK